MSEKKKLNQEDLTNTSCDTLEISEEEIFNLSANIIQSVFRGYILRKLFFFRLRLYLNFSWAFNFLENLMIFKFKRNSFDKLLYKINKKNIKKLPNKYKRRIPKIYIRKKYVFLCEFIRIRSDNFSIISKDKSIGNNYIKVNSETEKKMKLLNLMNLYINTNKRKYFNKWRKIKIYKSNFSEYKNGKMENTGHFFSYKRKNYSNPNLLKNGLKLNDNYPSLNKSCSTRWGFDRNINLQSNISLFKIILKKIIIRRYFAFFIMNYSKKIKNLRNIINILTSDDGNILSNIIFLIDKFDRIILNVLYNKAKNKLILYLKN